MHSREPPTRPLKHTQSRQNVHYQYTQTSHTFLLITRLLNTLRPVNTCPKIRTNLCLPHAHIRATLPTYPNQCKSAGLGVWAGMYQSGCVGRCVVGWVCSCACMDWVYEKANYRMNEWKGILDRVCVRGHVYRTGCVRLCVCAWTTMC